MNIAEIELPGNKEAAVESVLHLPCGLLGFEQIKRFLLSSCPEEAPFMWLQVEKDPTLAFLVLSPFEIFPDYQPELPDEDVEFLGLESPSDAVLYNIVTLRPGSRGTVNLKGPVVVNRFTQIGKQVVLANAAQYSVQHPLPVEPLC